MRSSTATVCSYCSYCSAVTPSATLAAILVLPYAAVCAPFWNVTDAAAESANRGWRRFLLLNFITGFFVTMLMIWRALVR